MTRIVLSPVEPGMRRIYHGRELIGHAITEWDARDTWNGSWRAILYEHTGPDVRGFRLRDLRAALEERIHRPNAMGSIMMAPARRYDVACRTTFLAPRPRRSPPGRSQPYIIALSPLSGMRKSPPPWRGALVSGLARWGDGAGLGCGLGGLPLNADGKRPFTGRY